MSSLYHKSALITGARGGIGMALVEAFAREGAFIWANARKPDMKFEREMRRIADEYHVSICPLYFDVTQESEVKLSLQNIRKENQSLDILVNVAGIVGESTSFPMTSIAKMKQIFETNFFGLTIVTQYAVRLMMKQNYGSIINISSVAGLDGEPAQYEYAASKAAVIGATKQLSHELAPFNIRVNAVAPGMIEIKMGDKIHETLKENILNKVIMKRMGKPEEVANVVTFLASDKASYMTGQVIRIDGGE